MISNSSTPARPLPSTRRPSGITLGRCARRVAFAASLLLAGCSGSTDPANELSGTYRLVAVNGEALPYVYYHNVVEGRTIEYRVHSAIVEFRTRHRVYDIRTLDFLDPRPDTIVSGYALHGTQLVFSRANTAARPAYSDTGTYEPAMLTMRMRHLAGAPDVNAVFLYLRNTP
jgi:hypothetical protein